MSEALDKFSLFDPDGTFHCIDIIEHNVDQQVSACERYDTHQMHYHSCQPIKDTSSGLAGQSVYAKDVFSTAANGADLLYSPWVDSQGKSSNIYVAGM